jgi:AcrR family transcriptional regulator
LRDLLAKIQIQVNPCTYLKNPESSDLGLRILTGSIDVIDSLGFEHFTFRKLATHIGSTEASVYRYFENKHKLLLYLSNWYWAWMEYRLVFGTINVNSPEEQLNRAIDLLVSPVEQDMAFTHINEIKLNRIVIAESAKAYLTKEVDDENQEGAFVAYKQLVARVSDIILRINPSYRYSHMLVSTVVEGAHLQRFFAEHLPKLTDVIEGRDAITDFCHQMVFSAIKAD